jgi:hypothetical protein
VLSLVEPNQVHSLTSLQQAAGVTPVSHRVVAGHEAVEEIASSGEPVPPPQPSAEPRRSSPARQPGQAHRRPGRPNQRPRRTPRPQRTDA